MGVDTKGFLFGENKKDFGIKKLEKCLKLQYKNVKMHNTSVKDCVIFSFSFKSEKRALSVFFDYSSYKNENYPELDDKYIVLFDLGAWGNSSEIMKYILGSFGGGYFLENDCTADWCIEAPANSELQLKKDYCLTFFEAIECVLSGECWVQGNDFAKGVVLSLKDGVVIVNSFKDSWPVNITIGLYCQKFKKVYTQPEANK